MDLRQLRQFVVLSESGSFHRAAAALHIAQPPLSVSIRKLEQDLGCALFVRHARGVTLTPAGQAVLAEARGVLMHADRVRSEARAAADGAIGKLRIGFVGSAVYTLLPRLVPPFRKAYARVDLVFSESTSTEILKRLEDRSLDVGLIRYPLLDPVPYEVAPLEQHRFVVALPAEHRFARRKRLSLAVLRDEAFIVHSAQSVPNLHSVFKMMCLAARFTPTVAQEATQVHTILALVESGLGVALVPASARHCAGAGVRFVPLGPGEQSIDTGIAMAWHKEHASPVVRNFVRIAREMAPRSKGEA